jgi:hypothetical protein
VWKAEKHEDNDDKSFHSHKKNGVREDEAGTAARLKWNAFKAHTEFGVLQLLSDGSASHHGKTVTRN